MAALLVPLVVMAGVAIPVNTNGGGTAPAGAETVTVGEYAVTYAESVPDERYAPLSVLGSGAPPTTSGVIVTDADRGVWTTAITTRALARDGTQRFRLGGLGWDRTVFAIRRGWRLTGDDVAYKVWLNPRDGPLALVHRSAPARAQPVVDGATVAVRPTNETFLLAVARDNATAGTAPLPRPESNVTVGGLEIRRTDDRLLAVANGTRVTVARRD